MKMKRKIFKQKKRYSLFSSNILDFITFAKSFDFERLTLNHLKGIELKFKQFLKIVFEVTRLKKKIIFVGFTDYKPHKFLTLFYKLNHSYLNNKIWINGLLTNPRAISYSLKSKRIFKVLSKQNIIFLKKLNNLDTKPDLIILCNAEGNLKLIREAIKLKIPIISLLANNDSIKNQIPMYYVIPSEVISSKVKLLKYFYLLFSAALLRNLKIVNKLKSRRNAKKKKKDFLLCIKNLYD